MKKYEENNKKKQGNKSRSAGRKTQPESSMLQRFFSFEFFRKRKIFAIKILIFAALFYSGMLFYYSMTPIDKKNENVVVDIPTGSSFFEVMEDLNKAGLIKHRFLFYSLAVIKGARRNIRAGEYEMNMSLTPWKMIDKLVRGDVKIYKVVIPEDLSMREIADRLYEHKLINKDIFFDLARDKEFLQSLNISADSIEGYLFPDTYYFERWMNTRRIMKTMVDTFWKKVTPEMIGRARDLKLDLNELITFASIIGKEAGNNAEKPVISAVFHNRIKRKMPLQSDPTAVYDLDDFAGKIVRSHLRRKSPYNTYVIRGLPPGPIANPGVASFRAALYPADVNYLYFVSKRDGTHHFSSSLVEHNQAVNRYIYLRGESLQSLKDESAVQKDDVLSPEKED
jgi:UPF0755 protein